MESKNPLAEAESQEEFKEIWLKYVEPWKEKSRECDYIGGDVVVCSGPAIRPTCMIRMKKIIEGEIETPYTLKEEASCSFPNCPRKEEFSDEGVQELRE